MRTFSLLFLSFFILGKVFPILLYKNKPVLNIANLKSEIIQIDQKNKLISYFINPNIYLINLRYLTVPDRVQILFGSENFRTKELVEKNRKIIFFSGSNESPGFLLKGYGSFGKIFAHAEPSNLLLGITCFGLVLITLLSRLFGLIFTVLFSLWLFEFNKFNYLSFPTFVYSFALALLGLKSGEKYGKTARLVFVTTGLVAAVSCLLIVPLYIKTSTFILHPDEPGKITSILKLLKNKQVDLFYYLHPHLLLKLGAFFVSILSNTTNFETVSLYARLVSLFSYFACFFVSFYFGNLIGGARLGILSALVWGTFLLPWITGIHIKEDALLTLFLGLNALFIIKFIQDKKDINLILAFIFSGLSFSAKYTGLISLFYTLAAAMYVYLRNSKSKLILHAFSGLIIFTSIFIFVNQINFDNYDKFAQGFKLESTRFQKSHGGVAIKPLDNLFLFYFFETFVIFEPLLGILFLASLINGFKEKRIEMIVLSSLTLLFYLIPELGPGKPAPQYHRYILPSYLFVAPLIASILYKHFFQVIFILYALITLVIKLNLALADDTRKISTEIKLEAEKLGIKSYYFGYAIFYPYELNSILKLLDSTSEGLSLFIRSQYICERFTKGRVLKRAGLTFVTCSLTDSIKKPNIKISKPFFDKPFFNPSLQIFLIPEKELRSIILTVQKFLKN